LLAGLRTGRIELVDDQQVGGGPKAMEYAMDSGTTWHEGARSGTTWHSDSGWLQGENLQMGGWRSGGRGAGDVAADVGVCGT
jgi:hypothetical protein